MKPHLGAKGETRTPTLFPELDPKSSASTSSATLADVFFFISGNNFVTELMTYKIVKKAGSNSHQLFEIIVKLL